MTSEEPATIITDPGGEHPAPDEARQVANSTDFVEAVAIALMDVVLKGAPGAEKPGSVSQNAAKQIAANPRREAERFSVALATDPAIVAATLGPDARIDPTGFAQLVEKLRTIWPVMVGDFGEQVVDHRDLPNTGKK